MSDVVVSNTSLDTSGSHTQTQQNHTRNRNRNRRPRPQQENTTNQTHITPSTSQHDTITSAVVNNDNATPIFAASVSLPGSSRGPLDGPQRRRPRRPPQDRPPRDIPETASDRGASQTDSPNVRFSLKSSLRTVAKTVQSIFQ